MSRKRVKMLVFFLILLTSTGGVVSCTLPTPGEEVALVEAGPQVWIDVPVEGLRVPVGQPVRIEGHAAYREGITHVEIWVDDKLYLVVETPSIRGGLVRFEQSWTPTVAGEYVIQAVAVGTDGVISAPSSVRLVVEAAPTGTPVLPTVPPTGLPTLPPTVLPTGTPFPPAEVSFWADRTKVTAGECTVLHWDVEHATAVFLNGDGVAGHGTRQVCPTAKTTYVLRVEAPGGDVERSVTIDVSAPPDTTAPPVPAPKEPVGGEMVDCPATEEQTLTWSPVSDPSGVVYYVKLQGEVKAGEWKSVGGWGPESGTEVKAEVQCGGIYRWTVRAEDGAGNISAWSKWAYFSVDLP